MQTRPIDRDTLAAAAQHYAKEFVKGTVTNARTGNPIAGHGYVIRDLYSLSFKDEFEFVLAGMAMALGHDDLGRFRRDFAGVAEPRRDDVFEALLAEKLAIRPDGTHIEGRRGTTKIGRRVVRRAMKEQVVRWKPRTFWDRALFLPPEPAEIRLLPKRLYWDVYAGELEERKAERMDAVDPLPEGAEDVVEEWLATNPRISAEAAIAMADLLDDKVNEGSTAATIRIRTGTQPADPDATESGTLLATLTMSDPAFGAATDDNPGGLITASAITDDTSADATGTAGYFRIGATGTGADDHIDGECGTSGADLNMNTVAIVAGATVAITSLTAKVPQL